MIRGQNAQGIRGRGSIPLPIEKQVGSRRALAPIPELSESWGVGRNVVRDALLQAQSLGLVRIHPRLGTFVQSPDFAPLVDALAETLDLTLMVDDKHLMHLIEARYMAERETVFAAASRRQPEDLFSLNQILNELRESTADRAQFVQADERFHLSMAVACGNPIMVALVRTLLVALRPYRMSILMTDEDVRNAIRMHDELYQCLMDKQGERAREVLEAHLMRGRQQMLTQLGLADESNSRWPDDS